MKGRKPPTFRKNPQNISQDSSDNLAPPPGSPPLRRRINIPDGRREVFLSRYQQGQVIPDHAFVSTAFNIPRGYMDRKVELVIRSRSARRISDLSAAPDEGEYLIPAGRKFKVMDVDDPDEHGVIRIYLNEVER